MKLIYLAHNLAAAGWLSREIVPSIHELGYVVNSSWLGTRDKSESWMAVEDVEKICRADLFILFSEQYGEVPGRGKYVEFGVALARNKPCMVVGPIDCIFYRYPNVMRVHDWRAALEILKLG